MRSPSDTSSPSSLALETLKADYWHLLRLEKELHQTYVKLIVGTNILRFSERPLIDLVDEARTKQFDLISEIAKIRAANIQELKTKSEILLSYYSSEIGDPQSDLVRSIALDLAALPLRDCQLVDQSLINKDLPSLAIRVPNQKKAKYAASAPASLQE
jgi:hypothetical protein